MKGRLPTIANQVAMSIIIPAFNEASERSSRSERKDAYMKALLYTVAQTSSRKTAGLIVESYSKRPPPNRFEHTWPSDGIQIPAIRTGEPLRLSGHAEMAYNTGQNVIQRGICDA
jgi:hypothetical protein